MENQVENQIAELLEGYVLAINDAQTASIAAFYAEEGLFMPEGFKTLTKQDLSREKSSNFLRKTDFKIEYTIEKIEVEDNFAFVSATAKTSEKESVTNDAVIKQTRDLFVLRKEESSWKIFRYVFNNIPSFTI
ncbi:nuclear transport factor 2 family protein [Sphingobacterium faecium]|uniref:nuclear transport factor 2 family protein n=1 Tax=Sphingobacterium faecium TaxID=34087 RepID=UPI003208FF10